MLCCCLAQYNCIPRLENIWSWGFLPFGTVVLENAIIQARKKEFVEKYMRDRYR